MNKGVQLIGWLHKHLVFSRRTEILSCKISELLPNHITVLDVGSGDGLIAKKMTERKPSITVTGIDVVPRKNSHIPVTMFDGLHIPYPDNSFDYVLLIDVIHHTIEQEKLLMEASRVARTALVIKDHYADSRLKHFCLSVLDWIGNKSHSVPLPFAFLNRTQWKNLWNTVGLIKEKEILRIDLYPFPFNIALDYPWNFIVELKKLQKNEI